MSQTSKDEYYKTKSTQMDGFVVQEIKLINKLYNGIKAVAKAENKSIEYVISRYLMSHKSIFDHPNYPNDTPSDETLAFDRG